MLDDVDKNSDLDMRKSRQTNGSDGNNKTAAAAPMSQISGVRRLQQSNSIVGIVPKFGVEVANEQPLAEVSYVFHLPSQSCSAKRNITALCRVVKLFLLRMVTARNDMFTARDI